LNSLPSIKVELARTEYMTPIVSAPLFLKIEYFIITEPDCSINLRTPAVFAKLPLNSQLMMFKFYWKADPIMTPPLMVALLL
jgi:hypothetical protein